MHLFARYIFAVTFALFAALYYLPSISIATEATAETEVVAEDASFTVNVVRNVRFGSFFPPSSGVAKIVLNATDPINSITPAQTGRGTIDFNQSGSISSQSHRGGNRVGVITVTSSQADPTINVSIAGTDLKFVDAQGVSHTLEYAPKVARNAQSGSLGAVSHSNVVVTGTQRHFMITGELTVGHDDPAGDYSGNFTFTVNN